MKMLIVTPLYPPDIGGPATYSEILERELPNEGILVEVISYGFFRHLPKILSYPLFLMKVLVSARGVDLVLALDPMHAGLSSWLASTLWNKKFIVRIAGDYAWEQGRQRFGVSENLDEFIQKKSEEFSLPVRLLRFFQTFVARRADAIIVPSNYLRNVVVAWGVDQTKTVVVYNAFIGVGMFSPREELRERFGFSGHVLLSAGRLVPWKGFATLIDLMPEILNDYPDCRLFIVGSGPLFYELKKEIKVAHLENNVIMLGEQAHKELLEHIYAADCFVLNTGYEGFSHQLLEVLAVGTPIVSTTVGGNPELIQDGENGVLVRYNNKAELKHAIEGVLRDAERASRMAESGRRFAQNFTVSRMINETRGVIEKVMITP